MDRDDNRPTARTIDNNNGNNINNCQMRGGRTNITFISLFFCYRQSASFLYCSASAFIYLFSATCLLDCGGCHNQSYERNVVPPVHRHGYESLLVVGSPIQLWNRNYASEMDMTDSAWLDEYVSSLGSAWFSAKLLQNWDRVQVGTAALVLIYHISYQNFCHNDGFCLVVKT